MPEQVPTFPTLLPPLGDELLADQALDAVSQQIPDTLDVSASAAPPEPVPFGLTWQWDFERNRFKTDGAGAPRRVYDEDNLRCWIQTAMLIARNSHPIYDDDIGMEGGWGEATDGVMIGGLANDVAAQEQYMTAVADCLMVHDRITLVTNFDFYPQPDDPESLYVEFEVQLDDGEAIPMVLSVPEN